MARWCAWLANTFFFFLLTPAYAQQLPVTTYLPITDSGSSVRVGTITITGNKITKEHIVRREFFLNEGDSMSYRDLFARMQETQNYLMNTALFVEANMHVRSRVDDTVHLSVDLKERWYIFPLPYFKLVDRNFNQWWVEHKRSLERVNYGLKFMWYNFTGRKDNLYVYLITGYNRQVQLKYEQPVIEKTMKHGVGILLRYSNQKEAIYDTRFNKQVFQKQEKFVREDRRVELDYYYRPAIKSRHTIKLAFQTVSIADSISKLNPSFFGSGTSVAYPEIAYHYHYFGADYTPYPTKGLLVKGELLRRGFSSKLDMWQLTGRVQYTHPVSKKTQLQLEGWGSIKLPFEQPFYNRQMLGYSEIYMRGLEYYVVDGVAGGMGKATLQTQVLGFTLNNPYKIKSLERIPVRIMLKLYSDAGYIHAEKAATNMLNNKLLHTWGVGLDIVTIYDLVLKVEYSFNQLGNRGLFLHSKNEF